MAGLGRRLAHAGSRARGRLPAGRQRQRLPAGGAVQGHRRQGVAATAQQATTSTPTEGILRRLPEPKTLRGHRKTWVRRGVVAGLVLTAVLVSGGLAARSMSSARVGP